MRELGLAAVIDLRRTREREREPSKRWPGFAAAVVENDILSDHADWADVMRDAELDAGWFRQDSLKYYRTAPFEPRHYDLYGRYFRTLADVEGPIVVHCAAGKDRTGLICALTHYIAGVSHDDMMADYLLTNDEARMARKIGFLGPWLRDTLGKVASDDALRVAVSVSPDYLDTAFAAIAARYGSIDDYIRQALGVDDRLRERVVARLVAAR
jgi:protein tyrosine/serine phosphatase